MKKLIDYAKTYLALVFIILYAPIFYLIFYSFNQWWKYVAFRIIHTEHYAAVFEDTRLIVILINTVIVALLISTNFNNYWCTWCNWHFSCEINQCKHVTFIK